MIYRCFRSRIHNFKTSPKSAIKSWNNFQWVCFMFRRRDRARNEKKIKNLFAQKEILLWCGNLAEFRYLCWRVFIDLFFSANWLRRFVHRKLSWNRIASHYIICEIAQEEIYALVKTLGAGTVWHPIHWITCCSERFENYCKITSWRQKHWFCAGHWITFQT